jgi:hypothetical protein
MRRQIAAVKFCDIKSKQNCNLTSFEKSLLAEGVETRHMLDDMPASVSSGLQR